MFLARFTVITLCLMSIRVFCDLLRLHSNLKWLSQYDYNDKVDAKNYFVLCIPAYREQDILKETIQYFVNLNYPKDKYKIVIATTAKENSDTLPKKSTRELAELYAKDINIEHPGLVEVIDYPFSDGLMAHQINYAAKKKKTLLSKKNVYFSVYNADSRPNPDTLAAVNAMIKDNVAKEHRPMILQQSSLFTVKNISDPNVGYWSMAGAAIHQSLWTLRNEISYYRKQSNKVYSLNDSKKILRILRFSRNAHCVGHGLYINGGHFLANPLPEKLLNEDLPYGLSQCCQRQAIHPVPLLEISLSPINPVELYRQKSVWFNPFFEFYGHAKTIIDKGTYISKFEVWFLTLQAYSSLIIWLTHTIFWIGSLVLSGINGYRYVAAWMILYTLYWVIPGLYYKRFLVAKKLDVEVDKRALLWGSFYVLSHSVGPWWGVCRWLKALSRGIKPSKPKTENI